MSRIFAGAIAVVGWLSLILQFVLAMINPIGSAIVENIGLNPFMERICRFFLNEELILPQIATWWCGQEKELTFVMKNFENFILKKIDKTEVPVENTKA